MRTLNPDRSPAATLCAATKHYGRSKAVAPALNSVDMQIRQGEVTSILGPNGAGKTTAIKLMLGVLRPTSGEAALFGLHPQSAAARMRTGAMMQISALPATAKVVELVRLFSSYYPAPMTLNRVLDIAGLTDIKNNLYGKLSGGQQQRVMFALAMCGDPDLLFLDEPTVGLDIETRLSFWSQIRRLINRGKTIILTTHYLEEADALSDRIVLINQGEIVADGTPSEIKATTSSRRVSCVTALSPSDLADHPAVHSVQMRQARLEVATSDGEAVVQRLFQLDPKLRDLEVVGAGIDEAFLHLTNGSNPAASEGTGLKGGTSKYRTSRSGSTGTAAKTTVSDPAVPTPVSQA